MLWTLLVAHLIGVIAAAFAGRRSMRASAFTAAIAPAATAVWAAGQLISSAEPKVHELVWVEGLDIALRFQTDALALMMTLLVSGIGALVFIYTAGYFSPDAKGAVRFPATLLAFSASMLGLVLADSIWTFFIFWEFTSVISFLLVGHKNYDPAVLTAARRALAITGAGGLALLAGLLILAKDAGTTSLTELANAAAPGTAALASAVLILIGAATKSAQVPFHVWLPGAMAAPTPVSAYLHSATMVKAGILLVAVIGPVFADFEAWKILGASFGIASMIWGGIGALRHQDAKLILAWGTISQLGLMFTLLAIGTGKAVFAAVSILFAHAIFKAALFLVVGEIDIRTGTRQVSELGGLYKSMPVAFGVALVSGLSMAGAPPLLGFPAKEAAIEASLGLSGTQKALVLSAIVGGSILTVAYTVRFLVATFGPGPDTQVAPRRMAMTIPAVTLGVASIVGFIGLDAINEIVRPAATELNKKSEVYSLIAWPGIKTAFVISMGILAAGTVVGLAVTNANSATAPAPIGADAADSSIDKLLWFAPRITANVQHGSLPVYLATMATCAILATVPFVTDLSTDHLVLWDDSVQGALAVAIVASAIAGAFVTSRLGAAMTLGAVGIGMTGLFLIHSAPDLALTQLLVETVIVVGFVIGLGHLGRKFPQSQATWRSVRIGVSVLAGLGVMAALVAAGSNPTGTAPIDGLTIAAVDEGGGKNIVNVILTDIRALDTLGEVVVLAIAAIGIAALAKSRRHQESGPETTGAQA